MSLEGICVKRRGGDDPHEVRTVIEITDLT